MYIAEISFFVKFIMNSILVQQVTRNKELRTCTIFMMVFGMIRPEGELTTYRVRCGHANH